jgi:hypothetical protein
MLDLGMACVWCSVSIDIAVVTYDTDEIETQPLSPNPY